MTDIQRGVEAAMAWRKKHPKMDPIEAAYEIAVNQRASFPGFSNSRWPEFVAAVKEAAQTPPNLP
jgi:hypothetical protein